MANVSYEESIKKVYWGLMLLGVVTLVEVGVSLFGKGHLGIDVRSSVIIGAMRRDLIDRPFFI